MLYNIVGGDPVTEDTRSLLTICLKNRIGGFFRDSSSGSGPGPGPRPSPGPGLAKPFLPNTHVYAAAVNEEPCMLSLPLSPPQSFAMIQSSDLECGAVQCSAVQISAVQWSALHYNVCKKQEPLIL